MPEESQTVGPNEQHRVEKGRYPTVNRRSILKGTAGMASALGGVGLFSASVAADTTRSLQVKMVQGSCDYYLCAEDITATDLEGDTTVSYQCADGSLDDGETDGFEITGILRSIYVTNPSGNAQIDFRVGSGIQGSPSYANRDYWDKTEVEAGEDCYSSDQKSTWKMWVPQARTYDGSFEWLDSISDDGDYRKVDVDVTCGEDHFEIKGDIALVRVKPDDGVDAHWDRCPEDNCL